MIKAEWTNADTLNLQSTCNQFATDCINRQDAIAAVEGCGTYILPNGIFRSDALYALKKLPSAQPEIIRCQDCKYAEESDEREWLLCHWYGDQWNEEDHWCSHAERRADG